MLEYSITAERLGPVGSLAMVRQAKVALDTSLEGRVDALNPVELLLGALAACIIKSAERAVPLLGFDLQSMKVQLHAVRQDTPPQITAINYLVTVETDESEHRLELLHRNIRRYGTISNTLALALALDGRITRKS
ncbi:osmotically inducible protein C [Devosia sp. Root436]|nr:OsmC family protein [Devosia sp. Root436]KQX38172.1 osmotically inducible protein C [Devosia sp. Root436]